MKTIDIVIRAGRSLRESKTRTLLTSLAIAVGAFTVTLSLAAGAGTRQYTDRLISSNVNPQVLMIAKDKKLFGDNGSVSTTGAQSGLQEYSDGQVTQRGVTIQTLSEDDIAKIAKIDGVASVEPVRAPEVKYVTFEGNDKKFTGTVRMMYAGLIVDAAAGKLPAKGAQLGNRDMVIPESFLETIGYKTASDAIGKTVTVTIERAGVNLDKQQVTAAYLQGGADAVAAMTKPETKNVTFTIVAVTKQSSMAVMAAADDLQISPDATKELYDYQTSGTPNAGKAPMAISLAKDNVNPNDVKKRIEDAGFIAKTAEDLQSMIFTVVNVLQTIVIGFGILALIASVFGIINTQYISVLERTQQIGLMKALGMRGKHVSKLFRYEAAWIGFLGGVIGSGAAYIVGMMLNPWITETLKLGEGNSLLVFEPLPIAILIVVLVLIAIAAGYFPARKAAKLDPIEALRTE